MSQRIVISEFMDAPAVERLRAAFDVDYRPTLVDDGAALAAAVARAHAWIVRNRTGVRGPVLEAARELRVVGRLGVGLDNIDVPACEARGIQVIAATGANAESVAEYVVTVAMMLLRGAYFSTAAVEAGTWPRQTLSQGREAAGKVLGLVGFGGIGRLTARKAAALGMRVCATDPVMRADDPEWRDHGVERRELDALLAESDVVSLHVPLTPQTRNLLDAARLARMKPDAILVNTARGGTVDEAAVAAMLREGRLGGAALDVFDREPLAARGPLAGAPRLILTPHIAGVTLEANERVSAFIAERVAAALGPS
ncbi:MAG TPA: hydroxyacid dehydrogenase [Usitatibacter sp.]|jgi:(S)-sulfolactate dehydrogenase|nr:hydroxyacid dehydrogenase [Usitatibacter sp.]